MTILEMPAQHTHSIDNGGQFLTIKAKYQKEINIGKIPVQVYGGTYSQKGLIFVRVDFPDGSDKAFEVTAEELEKLEILSLSTYGAGYAELASIFNAVGHPEYIA